MKSLIKTPHQKADTSTIPIEIGKVQKGATDAIVGLDYGQLMFLAKAIIKISGMPDHGETQSAVATALWLWAVENGDYDG